MIWFDWALVGWFLLVAVVAVSGVGKPTKPTTSGIAALVVILNAAIIFGLLWSHGGIR